jgi:hypothetical protein
MTNPLRGSIVSICLILLFLPAASSSQDLLKPNKEKKGMLHVVVTGGDKAKPVSGADVIVRSGDGVFAENTNTNAEGSASMSNVPFGSIKLQVAALGWKTSGLEVDFREGKSIQVKLEPEQRKMPPGATPTPTPTPR